MMRQELPERCGLKPSLRSRKPLWGFHVLSEGFCPRLEGLPALLPF